MEEENTECGQPIPDYYDETQMLSHERVVEILDAGAAEQGEDQ